jgi:hypothetical protein
MELGGYRGNVEEVVKLTFPGSLLNGEKPPPTLHQIADVVSSFEWIINSRGAAPEDGEGSFRFFIVGAQTGSLELWLQLVPVAATVVSATADAPGALRLFMELLALLKAERGDVTTITPKNALAAPFEEQAIKAIDKLRRSVKRADYIKVEAGSLLIVLHNVDFEKARRPPKPLFVEVDRPPIRPIVKKKSR